MPSGRSVRVGTRGRVNWNVLASSAGRTGVQNMFLDYALLRAAQDGVAFLRLYSWEPPCLSFGRNEAVLKRYDADRIKKLNLDTVRRPTGGRAVWHETELTYTIAGPLSLFGGLRETYLSIHQMIKNSLTMLGVSCDLAADSHPVAGTASGACFASPVGGEIVARGRKLVGSAQLREGDAFLQHGSLLLENRQEVVSRVTRGRAAAQQAISLSDCLDRHVSFDEVATAMSEHARSAWPGNWQIGTEPAPALDGLDFADPQWTWRR